MILADTAYFVALFQPRDSLHGRAVAWSRAVREPVLVTEAILIETVNALSAPADRPKVPGLVAHVHARAGLRFLPGSPELLDDGLALHGQRPDKSWSLTDCISFVVMQRHGIRLALTHDHHFEQAGFAALLRQDPPA